MKKVVLSLLAASALSTAFAQNSTSLNQNGSANGSNTFQFGANQNANITQNGTGNINSNNQQSTRFQVTNVNQQGGYNTANTDQGNNAGPSNYINISQTGYGNGTAGQRNNATVSQSNYYTQNSQANVTQRGFNMNATINQLGALNNVATVEQGGYASGNAGQAQTATIKQGNNSGDGVTSSNSTAYIQQLSSFTQQATTNQLGGFNQAYTYQNNNAGPNNVANTNQTGNNNYSQTNQSDFSTAQTEATVNQTGNSNTSYLNQTGGGAFTTDSYARVTQNGNNNDSRFQQFGGANNHADISQSGGFNSVQGMGGFGSFGLQNGNNNTLTVTQASAAGGPGHTAMISQVGTNNNGVVTQTTYP